MSKAILFDARICIGCGACSSACKEAHHLSGEPNPPELDAETFTIVKALNGIFIRNFCRHCLAPACASACPVSALKRSPEGAVIYDEKRCIGCRYCFIACPYGIPRYQWDKAKPLVRKCDFCIERQRKGLVPACAEICPTGATKFGERAELLKEAEARLKADSDFYLPRVLGKTEAGGASVLMLVDPQTFASGIIVPKITTPLPLLTQPALNQVPTIGLGGGIILTGIWWLTRRKNLVAKREKNKAKDD